MPSGPIVLKPESGHHVISLDLGDLKDSSSRHWKAPCQPHSLISEITLISFACGEVAGSEVLGNSVGCGPQPWWGAGGV